MTRKRAAVGVGIVFVLAGIAVALAGYQITPPPDPSGLVVPATYDCSAPLKQVLDTPRPSPVLGESGIRNLPPQCQDVGRTRLATAGVLALAGVVLLVFEVGLPTRRRERADEHNVPVA